MKNKHRVGTNRFTYLQSRNFAGLPFERYEFTRTYDPFQAIAYLQSKLTGDPSHWARNLHQDFGLGRVDLLHFFNTISAGPTPWVVSFSSFVPRWRGNRGKAYAARLLAGEHCKALVALSEHSAELQRDELDGYDSAVRDAILPKMRVVHPAQPLLVDQYDDKPLSPDRIVFTIVGAAFFRKGGLEILRACDALIREGYPLTFNIVSKMHTGDYASRSGDAELAAAKTIIAAHPDHINYYHRLPNKEVLDLFRQSHVGLLPTYDDAYGYSALEAQAAGCPVITTNVRVMPEINDDDLGWLIDVPRGTFGMGALETSAERKRFSRQLETGLYDTMKSIFHHPDEIRLKGERALDRIRTQHDPVRKAAEFEQLYDHILGIQTPRTRQLSKVAE